MQTWREILLWIALAILLSCVAGFLGCNSMACTDMDASHAISLHEQGNVSGAGNAIFFGGADTEPHLQLSTLNVGYMQDNGCFEPPTYYTNLAQFVGSGMGHTWITVTNVDDPQQSATLEGELTMTPTVATARFTLTEPVRDLTACEVSASFPVAFGQAALDQLYTPEGLRSDWNALPASDIVSVSVEWVVHGTFKGKDFFHSFAQDMVLEPLT